MNIEEDLTSLKEIVAIRKERCHGFIESDSCLISTKRLENLLIAYEKEKEKNKELRNQLNTIKDIYYNTNDLEELSDVLGVLLSNLKEE